MAWVLTIEISKGKAIAIGKYFQFINSKLFPSPLPRPFSCPPRHNSERRKPVKNMEDVEKKTLAEIFPFIFQRTETASAKNVQKLKSGRRQEQKKPHNSISKIKKERLFVGGTFNPFEVGQNIKWRCEKTQLKADLPFSTQFFAILFLKSIF